MITPPWPAWAIRRPASRAAMKVPRRFTSKTLSQSRSVISSSGVDG